MAVRLTVQLSIDGRRETLWDIDVDELLEVVQELQGRVERQWRSPDGRVELELLARDGDTPQAEH